MTFLTGVHVGAKCKRAILHVEGKAEDLQVARGDEPQHPVPPDVTCVVDVDVRTRLRDVIVHTASEWKTERFGIKTCKSTFPLSSSRLIKPRILVD